MMLLSLRNGHCGAVEPSLENAFISAQELDLGLRNVGKPQFFKMIFELLLVKLAGRVH